MSNQQLCTVQLLCVSILDMQPTVTGEEVA